MLSCRKKLVLHNVGWKKKIEQILAYIPIMNPHAKVVQQWNQFFVISCLIAIFIDPLFFFLLSVQQDHKCIVLNWSFATALAVVRSVTDAIYFLHMLLQFRLAYVAPESRVVGAGDLVDEPRKVAVHYLRGYFLLDFFVVLPLPQVMILLVIPKYVGLSGANYAKNLLRATVLLQYVPRIIRFVPLLDGQSANGFIFESAWANFVINLLMFVLAGHVVGSCWYLFGLQQISTLAGNLVPSYFAWEVLFTMAIIGLGLLLFALLIGNMQNFLQALGRRFNLKLYCGVNILLLFSFHRRLEMQLRRRDVEKWMSHRRLPVDLRRRVRRAERFTWAATQGVNEEELLSNLPEDIQRDIRRHFFRFLNKVRLFTLMDWPILDAICDKLRQNLYISGSDILYQGGPVDKMVFIVRDSGKIKFNGMRLVAIRTVTCSTNVEAFVLRASDLEEVTSQFARFLRNPRVQGAIRYESPYWRTIAATRIQVAWRYRKRRLKRAEKSKLNEESYSSYSIMPHDSYRRGQRG
nr:unnamed protein product [Digitaria exilis]